MKSKFYLFSLVPIVVALIATIVICHDDLAAMVEGSATQLLSSREQFFGCAESEVFRTSDMACYTPQGE